MEIGMGIGRREFRAGAAALVVGAPCTPATGREASSMDGPIGRMTAVTDQRDALVGAHGLTSPAPR